MGLKEDMAELFTGLQKSLTDTVTAGGSGDGDDDDDVAKAKPPKGVIPPQFKKLADDVADMRKQVDTVLAALAPGDDKGVGAGTVVTLLQKMGDAIDTHGTVLESVLERSAVRKSLRGDDFDGAGDKGAGDKGADGKEPVIKAGGWDDSIKGMLNGRKLVMK